MQLTADKKIQLLLDIFQSVRGTLDLEDNLEHLLDTLKTMLNYDAAGIFVLNQDLVYSRHEVPKEKIAGIVRRGFDSIPIHRDDMLRLGKGIIGHVIQTGSSLIVQDVRQNPHYVEGRRSTQSEIAVPIFQQDRAIGALNLESDHLAAFTEMDVEVLRFFADAAAISIEKAMLHKQLVEKELLDKQLQTAREVQLRLFPNAPPQVSGYDIAGICIPTDEIGGDYFDFIELSRSRLGLAVADVSGHGIAPALVMTAFRALLRTFARGRASLASIAKSINRLLPEFTAGNHFVTALYAVLEPEDSTLNYVSCGHPPPLLLRDNGELLHLGCCSPPLGIFKNTTFTSDQIDLHSGDLLILYTDGVVEIELPGGQIFGIQNLVELVQKNRNLPASELITKIMHTTQQLSSSSGYLDDFTLVAIRKL